MSESTNSVEERLKKILVGELKVDPDQIQGSGSLADDLGVDSADMVDLLFAIEDEFNVEISGDEVEEYQVFGEIVRRLKDKIG